MADNDKPPTRKEVRDSAYRLVGAMMAGTAPKTVRAKTAAYALELVLTDTRKGRTRRERLIQAIAGMSLVVGLAAGPK